MSILNKINIYLSLLIVFLCAPNLTFATHIVGGDMTYRCLGNDQFEITLTVRRDCVNGADEAQFDEPATLGIFDNFGSLQVNLGDGLGRAYADIETQRTIISNLDADCSIADVGSLCVEEAIYRDTIHLPYNKRGYFVSYQRCCRNVILNNIDSPLETGATYFVHILPTAALACNSQPVFDEWSDIYICAGQPFTFDNSAVDPDGDELVYRLCNPIDGATIDNPKPSLPSNPPYDPNNVISYTNGFSLNNVFGSGVPLEINSTTGVLSATPEIVGTYLVGICVDEYRNGVLFSTVRRDLEVNVVPCNDPITIQCAIPDADLCDGGTTINIINTTVGADSYKWFFDYPNQDPAFMSTEQNPSFTYPSFGNYTLRLEATRDFDGCTAVKEIPISIGGSAPKAEFTAVPISCSGDEVTIRFTDSTIGGTTNYTQSWEIGGMTFSSSPFILTFNRNETITVNYSIETEAGCVSNQNQAILLEELISSPYFDLDLISCTASGNTIQLTNPSGAATTWTITDGNTAPYQVSGSTATITINNSDFTIGMTSDNGCDAPMVSESYNLDDLVADALDVQLVSCGPNGNIFSFTNTTNANAMWTINDGGNIQNFTGDFFTTIIEAADFEVSVTFDNSCYGTITNTYNTNDFLQPDFDIELVSCSPNGNIFNFTNPTGTVANWTIVDGNTTSTQVGHTVSGIITGTTFSVTIDLDNGCAGPYTESFSAEQFQVAPPAAFTAFPISCTGDQVTVEFSDATIASSGYTQSWTINGTTYNSSPITQVFNRSEIVNVTYEITTTNGCSRSIQNQAINLEDLINSAYFEVELVSCDANGNIISLVNPANTATTWTITDGVNPSITLSGSNITTTVTSSNFTVSMVSDNGCNAAPITQSFNLDDLIDSATNVQLVACTPNGNLFSFTNQTAANAEWVIVDGQNLTTSNEDFFTVLIQSDNFQVTTAFDNSCYGTITNNYNAEDFLQPDFDVEAVACRADGNVFNFTNPTGTVANWTIVDGNTTTTQVGHTISTVITNTVFTVTIDLDNGCSAPYSETFNLEQFTIAPPAEFSAIPLSCSGNTVTVRFDDTTISNIGYQQNWTINGVSYNSSPITLTFDRSENIRVEYEIVTNNGCGNSIQNRTINLEELINSPYFDVELVSCDANGNTISLVNPSGAPTTWTITNAPGTAITLTGPSVTTTVNSDNFVVSMDSNNGCEAATITESFNIDDFIDSAIDVQLVACLPTGNIYSLTNATQANVTWTVQGGGSPIILTGDFVTVTVATSTFTVTADFDNSCYNTITNSYDEETFLQPEIDIELVACTENGTIFNFTNPTGTVANWTIVDNGVTTMQEGYRISGIVNGPEFTITMDLDNGCFGPYTETFNVNDLAPGVSISNNLGTDCIPDSGQVVTLSPITGIANILPTSYSWNYSIDGGANSSSSDPTVAVTMLGGQVLTAELTIQYANGCSATTNTTITASDNGGGTVAINNDLIAPCIDPNGQTVTFSTDTGGSTVTSYAWTYSIDGGVSQTSNDPTIAVVLLPGQTITNTVTVTFDDGCTATVTNTLTPQTIGTPDITVDEDCSNPDQTIITLTDNSSVPGATITSQVWTVDGVSSTENSVQITVIDQPITVTYEVIYDNGCSATYTRTFTPEEYTPTIDYNVEAVECIDDMILFRFTFSGSIPDCIDIESIVWTINGMTYMGPVVEVSLPVNETIEVGIVVTYTNGLVIELSDPALTSINTGDFITNENIDIINNLPGTCTDSLDLEITNPVTGADYEWSTDADFTNIVGTGTSFMGENVSGYEGTMYTRFSDDTNCTYGTGQITPETNNIQLSYPDPFILCPGDTAVFTVENLDPNQMLTYLWKDETGFLIEGGDTASPTVGVPTDQSEDFFMILCTENQFGCTSVDTINFMMSTPEPTTPFMWMAVDCGSLTVMFESNNAFGNDTRWDFGDTNMSTEENPTHTYDEEGTYTVTLSNGSSTCSSEPITQQITLPNLPTIMAPDTLMYGPMGPAIVDITTSVADENISWCLEDGTNIGMGNPLTYEPVEDTVSVIVKVVDEKGCTSDSTIVLIRIEMDPEIPEDVVASSSEDLICEQDTFDLMVTFTGNEEDYSFVWSPEECIVSGGDMANAVGTTTTSKTFNVIMTHLASGIDTVLQVNVEVQQPQVSIFADNGNPDEIGLPQVCLGSDITLSADPDDPECTYTWSTGETGSNIVVSPEENTAYTVTCVTSLGCEATSTTDIEVMPPQCNENDVYIPSAFSPNNDGVNDQLLVRSKFIRSMDFFVLNRWGQEVFRTDSQDTGWDGTFNGKQLAPDVYAYCLKVTCVNGTEYTTAGNVSLMK